MKKLWVLLSLIFVLNFYSFNFCKASDELREWAVIEEAYKYYVLDRIDGPDTPDYVKKFANDHNCFYMRKHYIWSEALFGKIGGVYSCTKKGKRQYIYDNGKKLRFARWYEKSKFRKHHMYGD